MERVLANAEGGCGTGRREVRNPFEEREPFHKRVVTVSVTKEQHEAFVKLQAELGHKSAGSLIKELLRAEIERRSPVSPREGTQP